MHRITLSEFKQSLSQIPASLNYLDTLRQGSQDYLSEYVFYRDDAGEVFSLSPDGSLHYYGGKPEVLIKVLDFLHSQDLTLRMIFTNSSEQINSIIQSRFNLTPRFYSYMEAAHTLTAKSAGVDLREATPEDQDTVNSWYAQFNAETQSNWPTPVVADGVSNLFLIYRDEVFSGAIANTLQSDSRFWIGRMWINPTQRKSGVGSLLIQGMLEKAKERNKRLSLLVSPNNLTAIKIYNRFGFKVIAENAIWYRPDEKLVTKDTI